MTKIKKASEIVRECAFACERKRERWLVKRVCLCVRERERD